MAKENKVETVVREIVEPLIAPEQYELVDVEYRKEGANWVLRLFIDHEEGIDLDDCQHVTHLINDDLDRHDPIPTTYLLEVSSPGIERPLKHLKDYQRFTGHKVLVKTFGPIEGKKEFVGQLLGVEEGEVVIKLPTANISIPLDQIAVARLVVDF